jgi:hypothetical protein
MRANASSVFAATCADIGQRRHVIIELNSAHAGAVQGSLSFSNVPGILMP